MCARRVVDDVLARPSCPALEAYELSDEPLSVVQRHAARVQLRQRLKVEVRSSFLGGLIFHAVLTEMLPRPFAGIPIPPN